jgi:glutamine synthetase adenylyltransferase
MRPKTRQMLERERAERQAMLRRLRRARKWLMLAGRWRDLAAVSAHAHDREHFLACADFAVTRAAKLRKGQVDPA